MTAEIAILNRSAVALAADSAVTLGVSGQQKIYNSVDKLFQLVLNEPVGIMIFGGAEYMGVPIETVIKKFRTSAYARQKGTLKEYSAAFFEFLEHDIAVPDELDQENIKRIVGETFLAVRMKAVNRYMNDATAPVGGGKDRTDSIAYLQNEIETLTKALISSLNKQPDNPLIVISETDEWCASHVRDLIDSVISLPLTEGIRSLLLELGRLLLQKDSYSRGAMGIVFAGFGEDEIFPKLQAFNSDGRIHGTVKRHEFRYVDIKRRGDGAGARIEAFAQKEMVHRFLDGIDPDYENYLRSAMREALNDLGKEVVASFVKGIEEAKSGDCRKDF